MSDFIEATNVLQEDLEAMQNVYKRLQVEYMVANYEDEWIALTMKEIEETEEQLKKIKDEIRDIKDAVKELNKEKLRL